MQLIREIVAQPAAFRRMLAVILITDMIWGVVLMFVLPISLIPAYLGEMGWAKWVIGPATSLIVLATPIQLLTGRLMYGAHRHRMVCLAFALSGVVLVVYGVSMLLLDPGEGGRLFFFLLAMAGYLLINNLGNPAFYAMLADNCPVRLRGRLFTLRTLMIAAGAMLGSLPVQWVASDAATSLEGFDRLILGGGLLVILHASVFATFNDRRTYAASRSAAASPRESSVRVQLLRLWYSIDYRTALLFMGCLLMAMLLGPFILTHAMEHVFTQDPASAYGRMNDAFLMGYVVAGLLFGPLADRRGYRISAILTALLSMLAFATAWAGHGAVAMYLAYGLIGVMSISLPTIFFNFGIELVPRASRMVIAAAPGVFCLGLQLSVPLLAGSLIDGYSARGTPLTGYAVVFVAGLVVSAIAALGFAMLVNEPRTGRRFVIKTLARVGV